VRIVLIEDNPQLTAALERGLAEEGFNVVAAADGALGLARLLEPTVDAAILDLGLPDMDGLTVVRKARAAGLVVPILILTARDALQSCVEGLDAGADDYLVKPFEYQELLARMRALLRRSALPRSAGRAFDDLTLMRDGLGAIILGRSVVLSPREFALLELFLLRRGEILGRPEILREVFGYDFNTGTNIVEVHVAHLRRKLGPTSALLRTVRGSGYVLAFPEGHRA